jgi:dihydroorotate dehydrogenase (NAD+) catalytic subunit
MSRADLSVQLAPDNKRGLLLANPVMTASGTFGYGTEYADVVNVQRLGAVICKGTTLEPRAGNAQPRMVEVAGGILNSIGMENIGVDALIREKAPLWAEWPVPIIINILGETVAEYGELAGRLDGVVGISALEVNVSCPNVGGGGIEFGARPESAAEVTTTVKARTSLPVIVKLSPNATDIVTIARAVADAGADSITLINTVKAMAIDPHTRKPVLANIVGGLSGPAIKPIALRMVYEVAGEVSIPVIGCGGISTATDAIEFLMAGASAVQVGTATFANPRAALDILEGIERFMEKEGIASLSELIGAAR